MRRARTLGPSRYRGRLAAHATKQAKQRALAWPLCRGLGLSLRPPNRMDTDMLGTFSGEIPREGTPAEVVRRKARLGMTAAKLPIRMASDGSFGAHPLMPFLQSDFVVLIFVNRDEGLAASKKVVTAETNCAHQRRTNPDEALSFATRVRFPLHALIVRPGDNPTPELVRKRVSDPEALRLVVRPAIDASPYRTASIETDMRAHAHPTRMRVIRHLGTPGSTPAHCLPALCLPGLWKSRQRVRPATRRFRRTNGDDALRDPHVPRRGTKPPAARR